MENYIGGEYAGFNSQSQVALFRMIKKHIALHNI